MWNTSGITRAALPRDGFDSRTLTHRWISIPVAVAIFCFAATTVRANDIVGVKVPLVTFKGNSICGPAHSALCVETYSAFFAWDNTSHSVVPGTAQITTAGPLGTFFFSGSLFNSFGPGGGELVGAIWTNSAGDELTADITAPLTGLTPGTYPIVGPFGPGDAGAGLGCNAAPLDQACSSWFFPSQELTPMPMIVTAGPVAQPPYKLTEFARSANGYSQPDSIVQWRDSVVVGFQNHVAKDGSDGKLSTIVQYCLTGEVQRIFSVPGHNDGLRLVGEDNLWALQNEDANPNLVVINLGSGQMTMFTFAPTVHGGGFDDMVVKDGQVFMTASNPNLNAQGVNVFPALVTASLSGSTVVVEPVLNGNGNATDIPSGTSLQLNLTDPDSVTIDPRGNLVLDSQVDGELVFIRHPLEDNQQVGRILITKSTGGPTTLDDTAFAPSEKTFLLFSDVAGDKIYRLDSPPFGFEPGVAYSASDTDGLVGTLNLDNGVVTPIVTGLGSARGMLFVRPGGI